MIELCPLEWLYRPLCACLAVTNRPTQPLHMLPRLLLLSLSLPLHYCICSLAPSTPVLSCHLGSHEKNEERDKRRETNTDLLAASLPATFVSISKSMRSNRSGWQKQRCDLVVVVVVVVRNTKTVHLQHVCKISFTWKMLYITFLSLPPVVVMIVHPLWQSSITVQRGAGLQINFSRRRRNEERSKDYGKRSKIRFKTDVALQRWRQLLASKEIKFYAKLTMCFLNL